MTAIMVVGALILDVWLGEPRRWHPLVGFGRSAQLLERRLWSERAARLRGVLALLVLTIPPVALAAAVSSIHILSIPWGIAVLYSVLGNRSLQQHAQAVSEALQENDLPLARKRVSLMVGRDTRELDHSKVAAATIESVLENGNDAVFAALFWFVLLGAPGAVLYRLSNTLDAMWGNRSPRYHRFGWAAARLDDLLNWIPARLTALSYAFSGDCVAALRCWRRQASAWESPNAGPVIAAGAGALRLRLGGAARYQGHHKRRPGLGLGHRPQWPDIRRSRHLLWRALAWWVAAIVICELARA